MSGRSQQQPQQQQQRQRVSSRSPDTHRVPPGSPDIPIVRDVEVEVERLVRIHEIGEYTAELVRAFCAYLKEDFDMRRQKPGISPKSVESRLRTLLDKAKICSQQQDCVGYMEMCRTDQAKSDARLMQFIEKHDKALEDHINRETRKEDMKQQEWQRFNDHMEEKFAMVARLIEGDGVTPELRKKASKADGLQDENATLQQLLDKANAAVQGMHRETEEKTSEIRKLQGELQALSNGGAGGAAVTTPTDSSGQKSPGAIHTPKSPRERDISQKLRETQRNLIDANKRVDQAEQARWEAVQEAESLRQQKDDREGELRQERESLRSELDDAREKLQALQNAKRQEDYQLKAKLDKSLEANAKLYEELCEAKGNLRVMTRVRPTLDADAGEEEESIDTTHKSEMLGKVQSIGIPDYKAWNSMAAKQRGEPLKTEFFGDFEHVFDKQSTNADVFDEVKPVIGSAFNGKRACIFAYGQSGSGKTYTLGTAANADSPEEGGIIPQSFRMLAQWISSRKEAWSYTVHAQFLEIYAEKVYDLLAGTREEVKIKVEQVPGTKQTHHFADCSSREITRDNALDMDEVADVLDTAAKNRRVRSTVKNDQSSRSHSVLTLTIVGTHLMERAENGQPRMTEGVVNLIDLAGSEKFDPLADKISTNEGTQINLSLSVLRKVIEQMGNPKTTRASFRESMLTKLLEPCLGNGSKVIMLAMVSPLKKDYDETRNTLKFAKDAKGAKMQTIRGTDNLTRSPTASSSASSVTSSPSQAARTPIGRGRGFPFQGALPPGPPPSSSQQDPDPRIPRVRVVQDGPEQPPAARRQTSAASFRERIANAQNCHDDDDYDYPPIARPRTPATPSESRAPRPGSKLGRSNALRRPSTTSGSRRDSLSKP
ncbi:KLPA protein [Apiospora marii]|uniref:KLPA protein n=1 Tax=Apiospora marii TaxID=335849 RepID=UPI00312E24AB